MSTPRRILVLAAAIVPLAAHAACSATNGDAIPGQVFDASALDAGGNPDHPDGGNVRDSAPSIDAPADAPDDAPKPNTAPVQVNEIFVDNDGLGDGAEYVELRAAPGTPADDLKLRILHANGKVKYDVTVGASGAKFNAAGLWVVGGSQTYKLNVQERVDNTITNLNLWGLDNARGAVQVVRGTTLLDVVGYAIDPDAGALPPPDSVPTSTGEGRPASVPDGPSAGGKGTSFGRKAGAVDLNNNAVDFCKMEASPGFAQKACLP